MLRLILVLWLCLQSAAALALSGPQTAQLLNQRLAATPAQCVGGKPVYACSGVLLRPMAEDHPQPFWHHDSESQARGTERFLFLRRDQAGVGLPGPVGYILHDRFTAVAQGKAYEVVEHSSEVMVRNWDEAAPGELAVQALYYDHRVKGALLHAQRGQREWFDATGEWLPLVRLDVSDHHAAFGFSTQEQLYAGYGLAERLNARYIDTGPCSGGRAGYFCNGIILRMIGPGDFHAWNPSDNSIRINGVAFTYARLDAGVTQVVHSRGYVIRELSAPAVRPFEPGCVYPADGATNDAPAMGVCTYKNVCAALGVVDVAGWRARYQNSPRSSCALGFTAADLQLMLDIRKSMPTLDPWNEVVMVTWPRDIGEQLPIEAVIYAESSFYEGNGLQGARYIQRDYLEQTGRYLPLLKTDLASAGHKPFSFDPDDQSMP